MIAVGTAIFYNNSVLLAKRIVEYDGKPVPFAGHWAIFTGAVEQGESLREAAARETYEESVISVSPLELIPIETLSNNECTLHVYAYEAPSLLIPVLDYEHTEYGWFSLDSLESFPDLIDENLQKCLTAYAKKRK